MCFWYISTVSKTPYSSAVDLSSALVVCHCATTLYATITIHNTQENKTKLPLIYHTIAFDTTDLRDHKCNRPNVVGKDEDYCCRRCVNIL
jgi:hypothetical protein